MNTEAPILPNDPTNPVNPAIRLLGLADVVAKTGLSRSTIYAKMNPKDARGRYDADFPVAVSLSSNRVAWVESEIDEWLRKRLSMRAGVRPIQ